MNRASFTEAYHGPQVCAKVPNITSQGNASQTRRRSSPCSCHSGDHQKPSGKHWPECREREPWALLLGMPLVLPSWKTVWRSLWSEERCPMSQPSVFWICAQRNGTSISWGYPCPGSPRLDSQEPRLGSIQCVHQQTISLKMRNMMEYYSALKTEEVLPLVTLWMIPEDRVPGVMSLILTGKSHKVSP